MATVLVVGSGGREHALARSLADDADVDRVLCVPGNAGTAALANVYNVPQAEPSEVVALAVREDVDLAVVGPEDALIDGLADELRHRGVRAFGFGRDAAQLRGSKIYAKRFMSKHGVPSPPYRVFNHPKPALSYLEAMWAENPDQPYDVKPDEPCQGQGNHVVRNVREAKRALHRLLSDRACGVGERVVVEEGIGGHDASLTALTDGQTLLTVPPAHVQQRLADSGTGPSTEGMGAYAPAALLDEQVYGRVEAEIVLPTLDGLHTDRAASVGALDLGLRVDPKGKPHALAYHVGFGDPQTQTLLALLASDLYPVLSACEDGRLDRTELRWRDGAAVSVVLTVEGYPHDLAHRNEPIVGLADVEAMPDVFVDHGGTDRRRGQLVTRGGRVLTVTGRGPEMASARERAYEAIGRIRFPGMSYRRDIAERAL
ncbi:MAG: phosphoribosylamine--glycine ligase [Candidatus Bipolaricaulia bacterium]